MIGLEPTTSCMPCKRSSQVSYTPVFVVYYNKISAVLSRIRRALIETLARTRIPARPTVFKTEPPKKQMIFSTAPFPSVLRIRRSPHEGLGGRRKMRTHSIAICSAAFPNRQDICSVLSANAFRIWDSGFRGCL